MKKLIVCSIASMLMLSSCHSKKEKQLSIPLGEWRAIVVSQGKEIPFHLISKRSESGDINFVIENGEEKIVLDKFDISEDTLILPMHIFDTKIVAKLSGNTLNGIWTKNYYDDYTLPFRAEFGKKNRFETTSSLTTKDFSGRWATEFSDDEETYPAIGEFQQNGDTITGTFLTETGDYRYLEGVVTENGFKLSTFDGEHAYLFEAREQQDTLKGEFWSGKSGHYYWTAYRNSNAALANADSLTVATNEAQPVTLAFPNEKGDTVKLSDPEYNNKVVIIQVLGSWCPNCMDETAFLSKWYKENNDKNVEIIGLAFERKSDFEYGASRIKILKNRYDIDYPVLFAGKNDRATTKMELSMISDLVSFPTTIFLDKDKRIAKIHTGFSGPGTGEHFEEFVRDFDETINRLLAE